MVSSQRRSSCFPISLFFFGASKLMAGFKKFGSLTIEMGALSFFPWFSSWNGIAIPEALSALVVSIRVMMVGRGFTLVK